MTPVPGGRSCAQCARTVHDLSALSADEARTLLAAADRGELCVRYVYEPGGRVLHRGDELGARRVIPMNELVRGKWARAAAIAGVAVASVVFEACGGARGRYDYTPHRIDERDAGVDECERGAKTR